MRLEYSPAEIAGFTGGKLIGESGGKTIREVYYDSRKIVQPNDGIFFALTGPKEEGAAYVFDAYEKGIRTFVIPSAVNVPELKNAAFIVVHNTLTALQQFAARHRLKFAYPVVAITGSVGKTIFKEWAWHILSSKLRVVKSPKSFNSQIGVALSLLEMHAEADVALIEVGISEPGEMERLEKIIQPTIGVFTAFGTAHRHNFESPDQHLNEKLKLFRHCVVTLVANTIELTRNQLSHISGVQPESIRNTRFSPGFEPMLGLLAELVSDFDFTPEEISNSLNHLPQVALRLETFAGVNGNLIINDTYSLDMDALREALTFQDQLAGKRNKVAIIGGADPGQQLQISALVDQFPHTALRFLENGLDIDWQAISNSVVLIKGKRTRQLERVIAKSKAQTHSTVVEINLSAIRHNVSAVRKSLPAGTKILAMVKASGYGSGAERIAGYLEKTGVEYFGVAFIDEGISLREAGITAPIIVMNPEGDSLDRLTQYNLEPAVYSFDQMDAVITQLLYEGRTAYPVHLKFDTGMNRLGFEPEDLPRILEIAQSQPEISVVGVYSHLADADNYESDAFTVEQLSIFSGIHNKLREIYPSIIAHIANSEAALRFPKSAFDMIRLGIALYGYTVDRNALRPSISWKSTVSQIKNVRKGESIGYGRSFLVENDMRIAIVPVGYADGFPRSLSNGKGFVVIDTTRCAVVGKVCMDMIMVDISQTDVQPGATVEIIGEHQTMEEFAVAAGTIPYEIMTGMSARMHRIYIEE